MALCRKIRETKAKNVRGEGIAGAQRRGEDYPVLQEA